MIYKVKEADLIGELENVPIEIVQKMVEYQYIQTGKCDVSVFQRFRNACSNGFSWRITQEGRLFWEDILTYEKFHLFYEKYPKVKYPKLMWVSYTPEFKLKTKRVVFMEKCDGYLAWANAETFEAAEKAKLTQFWEYAIDVEEEKPKEYTIQEICEMAGLDMDKIKIKITE